MSIQEHLDAVVAQAGEVIVGKERQIRLAVACLLAGGHLLIEDVPGVGKTTLAQVLARSLGLEFNRIQFTSDLLPGDILGVSIYERDTARFRFSPGPVFAQMVLADEINRASPKTQSALLEAMEEQQVSVEGETRPLPRPFFVIATQNPAHQVGTFALPESQLDRFLMRVHLGYPDPQAERRLLRGEDRRAQARALTPCLGPEDLLGLQQAVQAVHVSDGLLDYVQALLEHTRQSRHYVTGLSPRAALGLLRAARAWALMAGRDHVLPEDIQAVLPSVAGHRLRGTEGHESADGDNAVARLLAVAVP